MKERCEGGCDPKTNPVYASDSEGTPLCAGCYVSLLNETWREENAALKEKVEELERRDEWLPIDSAQKDGQKVLLCRALDADDNPITGDAFGLFVQVAAWWGSQDGWVVYCDLVWEPSLHFEPTHWRPMLAPPISVARALGRKGRASSARSPRARTGPAPLVSA